MQNRSYSEQDVKETLKQLICKRQPTKAVQHTPVATASHEKPFSNENEAEVIALKNLVDTLSTTIKEQEEELKKRATDTEKELLLKKVEELEASLTAKQRTKSSSIEDAQRQMLIEQLKEQNAKLVEFEQFRHENLKAKNRIIELEKMLAQFRLHAPREVRVDPRIEDLQVQIRALTEGHRELSNGLEKKESDFEGEKIRLNQTIEQLTAQLESTKKAAEEQIKQHIAEREAQIKQIQIQNLERKNELELLEQHLARRVKENAVLSAQIEEYTESLVRSSNQNELLRKTIQEMHEAAATTQHARQKEKEENEEKLQRQVEESKEWKGKYESLFATWETQNKELKKLRAIKQRFVELESLISKCAEIIANPVPEMAESSFDTLLSNQVVTKRVLFE